MTKNNLSVIQLCNQGLFDTAKEINVVNLLSKNHCFLHLNTPFLIPKGQYLI